MEARKNRVPDIQTLHSPTRRDTQSAWDRFCRHDSRAYGPAYTSFSESARYLRDTPNRGLRRIMAFEADQDGHLQKLLLSLH
jgi:hypothetical protein